MTVRARLTILGCVLGALLAAPASRAQDRVFVRLGDEIVGESTDPDHLEWIDALALAHGTINSCDFPVGGGGKGCGASAAEDLSFLKTTDGSTPHIRVTLAQAQLIPVVEIDVCREGFSGLECYYELTLDDVRISSVVLSGNTCIDPASCAGTQTESVSLEYRQIEWKFTIFEDGKAKGSLQECFDFLAKKSC